MPSKVTKTHFATLWNRQRGICWLCKTAMDATQGSDYSATIDHVTPRAQGGSSKIENLKLAHKKCNEQRGDPPPLEKTISDFRPSRSDVLAAAYAKYRNEMT